MNKEERNSRGAPPREIETVASDLPRANLGGEQGRPTIDVTHVSSRRHASIARPTRAQTSSSLSSFENDHCTGRCRLAMTPDLLHQPRREIFKYVFQSKNEVLRVRRPLTQFSADRIFYIDRRMRFQKFIRYRNWIYSKVYNF